MTDPEVLKEAISQGYNPDYTGENAKTPEQFVEDGKKIAPIQAERYNTLEKKFEELKKTNEGTNQTLKEFMEQQNKVSAEARKAGFDSAMSKIDSKKREAVSEADENKYNTAVAEEKELKKQNPVKEDVKPAAPVTNKNYDKWIKNNNWYLKDEELKIEADILDSLANPSQDPSLRTEVYLKVIEKKIKKKFPGKFGNTTPNNIDESNNTVTGNAGKKDYANLPKEAKKMCDMQVKSLGITKEEYCANFDWSVK